MPDAPARGTDRPGGTTVRRRVRHHTVENVVALLESLANQPDGRGVRELARGLSIDKSAVSRLLQQLQEAGMVEQDAFSGRVRIGPSLFALAATVHARDTLWQAAEPIVRELSTRYNETCYLAVRDGDEVVFREKVDCTHRVRYVIDPGERAPLHAGAGGRAVLLGISSAEARAALERTGLPEVTPRTITDLDALLAQVDQDRGRGYAVSRGERVPSGGAIAAPYFGAEGRCLGSVVYTCPAERWKAHPLAEVGPAVNGAATELSRRLGHR